MFPLIIGLIQIACMRFLSANLAAKRSLMAVSGQMHAYRNASWVCVHARVAGVNAGPVLGVLAMACAGETSALL